MGDLYGDDINVNLKKIDVEKELNKVSAIEYTKYFMIVLLLGLSTYFFMSIRMFTFFTALSAMISLFFGLLSPILMVKIHKEVEYLGDIVLSFESKGIMGSIIKLWESNDYVVAAVILIFSVIIPVLKTFSLILITIFIKNDFIKNIVSFFTLIGKWSMVDVFVVAIFLVYLTTNKGDVSHAEIEIGLYFFLAYVIISMIVSISANFMLNQKIKFSQI